MEAVTPGDALCEVVADQNCLWSPGLHCDDVCRVSVFCSVCYACNILNEVINEHIGS